MGKHCAVNVRAFLIMTTTCKHDGCSLPLLLQACLRDKWGNMCRPHLEVFGHMQFGFLEFDLHAFSLLSPAPNYTNCLLCKSETAPVAKLLFDFRLLRHILTQCRLRMMPSPVRWSCPRKRLYGIWMHGQGGDPNSRPEVDTECDSAFSMTRVSAIGRARAYCLEHSWNVQAAVGWQKTFVACSPCCSAETTPDKRQDAIERVCLS